MLVRMLNRLGLYTRRQMIHQKIDCSISYKYVDKDLSREKIIAAIQNTPLIGTDSAGWPGKQDISTATWDEFKKGIPPLEPGKHAFRFTGLAGKYFKL